MVQWAEAIAADDSHGYAQDNRTGNPDYDCSSFVAAALRAGGFNIRPDSWTGNLFRQLRVEGWQIVHDNPRRGDIYLNQTHHVVIAVNEYQIVHASINEKGTITGGQPGDQTGKEICIRDYYEPYFGWDYHLRYFQNKVARNNELESVVRAVIRGIYGNGQERRFRLEREGYNYDEVQAEVNRWYGEGKV